MSEIYNDPLVTVYVVNHNYGHYLKQAMDSLLEQSMKDFEIILIDDGSTDDSKKIIEKYAEHNNVYIVFQKNKGLIVSNNIALRLARGKYIMRLDADDYLDPNALNILSGTLENNPKVGLVFPDYYQVNENAEIIDLIRRHDFDKVTLLDQPAHGACTMIRCELLRKLGGYDEAFNCQDGYDLWIRFIQHSQVKNVNLPLFYYRQHEMSLTKNESRLLETRSKILSKQTIREGRKLNALAVIPIRGQKTDPHSLSLRDLGNKKVIDWTIESAMNAKSIMDVVVTTPDKNILDYIKDNYSNEVFAFERSIEFARYNIFYDESIFEAIHKYEKNNKQKDAVAILTLESPFRKAHQIDAAIDVMQIFDTDRVISVRPEVVNYYQHNGDGLQALNSHRELSLESNQLFRDLGVLNIARRSFLEKSGEFFGGKIGHVVIDQQSSHMLHSTLDWEVACLYAKQIEGEVSLNLN